MLHKLIESVTANAAISTALIFLIGYGAVQLFAWKARKEAKRDNTFDESEIYR